MNDKDYIQSVLKTESNDFPKIRERWEAKPMVSDIAITIIAIRCLDRIKKAVFYGKAPKRISYNLPIAVLPVPPNDQDIRLFHSLLGLATEVGELLEAFVAGELDHQHLKEEFGDIFWYLGLGADSAGLTFEEIKSANIAKLKARYGDKFSEDKAINRDLDKEVEAIRTTNAALGDDQK